MHHFPVGKGMVRRKKVEQQYRSGLQLYSVGLICSDVKFVYMLSSLYTCRGTEECGSFDCVGAPKQRVAPTSRLSHLL